ncbi:XdhC family protein [Saccharospirillum impatiens]|uniref:XdhC family protein n=1 Tax=Saccharospirillum impatiens TaxID=169438 RepID=UPI0004006079|nr:XdhC family protein [Saccharospirillum impatiens]
MSGVMDSEQILQKASELKAAGVPFALATVVRTEQSTSAKAGAKAIVQADGTIQGWVGGGCAQPAVLKTVRQALADGEARLIRIAPDKEAQAEEGVQVFGMSCYSGGVLDIFIEPVVARPGLLVIGVSPVAQALVDLASRVGFSVTLARPDGYSEPVAGAARQLDSLDLSALSAAASQYVVVATQGKKDEAGLEAALATGTQWLAFVASEKKAQRMRDYLLDRGQNTAAVTAIRSPAGIEIGARTPEEIALSVLAALVQARRSGEIDLPVAAATAGAPAESGAVAIDPICGMTVDLDGARYRSEYRGEPYYFCCAGCQRKFDTSPADYMTSEAV